MELRQDEGVTSHLVCLCSGEVIARRCLYSFHQLLMNPPGVITGQCCLIVSKKHNLQPPPEEKDKKVCCSVFRKLLHQASYLCPVCRYGHSAVCLSTRGFNLGENSADKDSRSFGSNHNLVAASQRQRDQTQQPPARVQLCLRILDGVCSEAFSHLDRFPQNWTRRLSNKKICVCSIMSFTSHTL